MVIGLAPSTTRSSVQYSFSCSRSSEAKSSSGRKYGPASNPTTENPPSASPASSGPPPAPVPTMTKSTASSSLNWRIGTQPPRLKTSGARPFAARGPAKGSDDMGVLPSRMGLLLAGGRLDGFPGVAPVQSHPHITTGTRRTPEADLVPSGWMRVVRVSDVGNDSVLEKELARHIAPRFTGEITVLNA